MNIKGNVYNTIAGKIFLKYPDKISFGVRYNYDSSGREVLSKSVSVIIGNIEYNGKKFDTWVSDNEAIKVMKELLLRHGKEGLIFEPRYEPEQFFPSNKQLKKHIIGYYKRYNTLKGAIENTIQAYSKPECIETPLKFIEKLCKNFPELVKEFEGYEEKIEQIRYDEQRRMAFREELRKRVKQIIEELIKYGEIKEVNE